jgi:haloacetate dehalogenase
VFEGFTEDVIAVPDAEIYVRHGGSGPPVLLLHGHPRTHATWHRVAAGLSGQFTVVCPDLRGFGRSSKPADHPAHVHSSKRAKAHDCVNLMRALGHQQFAVVGHDRGALTAFRAAMDHPTIVTRLMLLDSVPIVEHLERCTETFARLWWHWFFFAQPGKPEQAILADPEAWYGNSATQMGDEAYADYLRAIHDPATVHTMIEDYRAGLGIDRDHDVEDRRQGRKIACPLRVLWARDDDLETLYGDVLAVWQPWATDLSGHQLPCGHHMAEEIPERLANEIAGFLAGEVPPFE